MADNNFNITISLDSLGIHDQLSPIIVDTIQSSIQTSLALVKDRWQQEAQKKLNSTRPLYLMGLQWDSIQYPFEGDNFAGAVMLKGQFPNMLDSGFGHFDMKVGFSKSKRIKKKDNGGWYLTIPIRHSTPGSFMYGSPMPKDIYGVAKKLGHKESLSYPGAGDVSWAGYQRKNKTYDGLTRIVKSYQKATQSQYMTFRRVSDKSAPNSWMHPGFAGIHAAQNIMPYAQKTFTDVLTSNLSGIK